MPRIDFLDKTDHPNSILCKSALCKDSLYQVQRQHIFRISLIYSIGVCSCTYPKKIAIFLLVERMMAKKSNKDYRKIGNFAKSYIILCIFPSFTFYKNQIRKKSWCIYQVGVGRYLLTTISHHCAYILYGWVRGPALTRILLTQISLIFTHIFKSFLIKVGSEPLRILPLLM